MKRVSPRTRKCGATEFNADWKTFTGVDLRNFMPAPGPGELSGIWCILFFSLLSIFSFPQFLYLISKYFGKGFLDELRVACLVLPAMDSTVPIKAVNIGITQHFKKRNEVRLCVLSELLCVNSNVHPIRDILCKTKHQHAITTVRVLRQAIAEMPCIFRCVLRVKGCERLEIFSGFSPSMGCAKIKKCMLENWFSLNSPT